MHLKNWHLNFLSAAKEIGLGSDMDGGFAANKLPEVIDLPADLPRLADALAASGRPASCVRDFRCGNWLRFVRAHLPR